MEQRWTRLAEVFAREKTRFLRFVQERLFDPDETEAEDIVSDVVFNLLRRADVIGEIENLSAYIYRSLANRIVDRRRGHVPTVPIDGMGEDESAPVEISDEKPGPEKRLEQRELRDRLFAAISRLTPKERAVWLATEVDGRSFRDLAEEWGEPIGTLLSRKSRAAATLRQLLSDYRDR
jgi:RNA polymerase sigma factor (sigma-70 family)